MIGAIPTKENEYQAEIDRLKKIIDEMPGQPETPADVQAALDDYVSDQLAKINAQQDEQIARLEDQLEKLKADNDALAKKNGQQSAMLKQAVGVERGTVEVKTLIQGLNLDKLAQMDAEFARYLNEGWEALEITTVAQMEVPYPVRVITMKRYKLDGEEESTEKEEQPGKKDAQEVSIVAVDEPAPAEVAAREGALSVDGDKVRIVDSLPESLVIFPPDVDPETVSYVEAIKHPKITADHLEVVYRNEVRRRLDGLVIEPIMQPVDLSQFVYKKDA